ncbi:MAG: HlyD family efflux transporter periplasmic adaptor subunit, partial [Salana multivorans]|nr:HlyD family efflux transporter periplasmic adaptor subunit [Salana multivorans]
AQRILADQAAVDVAAADLAIARAAQAAGCLTAPIAGTVAQVALAVGDEVEAGSTTAVVTVLGEDGYVVTATMDLADVQVLAVGQPASGSVGGSEAVVTGAVSSIGLTNVSSTTTPRFDVTIAVDDPTSGLLEGASASLTVAVAERSAVTIVPTSAVHVEGGSATVTVLDGGETTSVPVTLGAIGPSVTEIVEGLEAGQQVVLADLTMEIGGEEESSGGLSGLAGSSGGAGGPDFTGSVPGGGGFPGGGGGFPGAG